MRCLSPILKIEVVAIVLTCKFLLFNISISEIGIVPFIASRKPCLSSKVLLSCHSRGKLATARDNTMLNDCTGLYCFALLHTGSHFF